MKNIIEFFKKTKKKEESKKVKLIEIYKDHFGVAYNLESFFTEAKTNKADLIINSESGYTAKSA